MDQLVHFAFSYQCQESKGEQRVILCIIQLYTQKQQQQLCFVELQYVPDSLLEVSSLSLEWSSSFNDKSFCCLAIPIQSYNYSTKSQFERWPELDNSDIDTSCFTLSLSLCQCSPTQQKNPPPVVIVAFYLQWHSELKVVKMRIL